MAGPAYYPLADRTAQWFGDDYPGSAFSGIEKLVIHSTEGTGWPDYGGGSVAPHLTVKGDFANERLIWRQHFSLLRNARALRNADGGVQTNLDGVVQVEIIGTCDRSVQWRAPHFSTWELPGWATDGLGLFVRWLHQEHGVQLKAPGYWPAFPPSVAQDARARMSGADFNAFRGVLGHVHVPENTHGDPGDLPIATILRKARPAMTDEELTQIKNACIDALRTNIAANENGSDPTRDTLSVEDFIRMGDTKLDLIVSKLNSQASATSTLAARLAAIELALSGVDLTQLRDGMTEASQAVIENLIRSLTSLDIRVTQG